VLWFLLFAFGFLLFAFYFTFLIWIWVRMLIWFVMPGLVLQELSISALEVMNRVLFFNFLIE
jgi:hypothetical protein